MRFQEEHLRCFGAASLDFNPLHVSESYARTTSSGERVAYGVLGFLACLPEISVPAGQIPADIRIDFKSPLTAGVDYVVTAQQEPSGAARFALLDGTAIMLRGKVQFAAGTPAILELPETGTAPRTDSRRMEPAEFEGTPSFQGSYAPPRAAYRELMDLLGIDCRVWGDGLPIAAICSSYVTGMELPGENALYSGLRLRFLGQPQVPVTFEIALSSYSPQFGMAQSNFVLGTWAQGEISAIVRPPRTRVQNVMEPGSGRFAGKTALIVGASRGLGAAMALEIVAEGGTVIGIYAQSQQDADELRATTRSLPGHLIMKRGDASDLNWCAELKSQIKADFGKLDLLVCNAAPAIQPLRVEEASFPRITAYLATGFALVAAPLSSFLEFVSVSSGRVLLVSSSAVEDPPAVWPHYVALKSAAEGLIRTAAVANRKVTFWIARPGRMLTDLSDTPMGRLSAEMPQTAARRMLDSVSEDAASGEVHFCR